MSDPVRKIIETRAEWTSEAIYELETIAHAAETKTLLDLACAMLDHILIIGELSGSFQLQSEMLLVDAEQLKKRIEELERELKDREKKVQYTMFEKESA